MDKQELLWLLAVTAALASGSASQAADVVLSGDEQAWIAENPTIRVHNETDWPPFNFVANGRPQGLSIDVMNVVADKVGLKVEYVSGPTWAQFLDMMKSDDLDVMLNIVRTPDRQEYMLYTRSYAANPNAILSRRDTPYDSLEQLFGKTVAVPKGFFYEEVLGRDFPQVQLYLSEDTTESMKAVSFGKADAALGELAVFNYLIARNLMTDLVVSGEVKMGDPEYALLNVAVRDELPILRSILDKALESIGPEETRTIRQKWLGGFRNAAREKPTPVLSDQERGWLNEHRHIRLGVDPAYPPFEFVAEDGTFSGMASDYVRLVSERLGIYIEVVPDLSWRQVLDGARARELDLISAAAETPERREYLEFATPHMSFPVIIVTRDNYPLIAGLDDLAGKTVALPDGYAVMTTVIREFPAIAPHIVASPKEALEAVALGKADATVMNLAVASFVIRSNDFGNLKIASPADIDLPGLSFAVRSDWPEFVTIIEKAIASITSEEELAIRDKWVGVNYEPGIDVAYVRQVALQVGGVAAVVLIVILVWNRRLQREVTQRKLAEGHLRLALDHMSDGIYQVDGQQRYTLFNDRYKELLGVPDEMIQFGKPIHDVIRYMVERSKREGKDDDEKRIADRMDAMRRAELMQTELETPTSAIEFRQSPSGDGGVVVCLTSAPLGRIEVIA